MITRVGGSVLLVVAEAAWVMLFLDAVANGTAGPDRPAVALPFVAVALAAGVTAVLAAVFRRWRWALLAALLVAAVTAELMTALTPGVALLAAPSGQVAARAMTWSAVVAVLACGRGLWLGRLPPSETQAAASLLLGWVVTISILIHRAEGHSPAFGRATSDAGWVLAVFFVAGFGAVGWAHVRSLERFVNRRAGSGPGAAWLVVTGVPLAAVALLAFLLGGIATSVVPSVASLARALGRGISVVGTWLFSHLNLPFHFTPHAATSLGSAGRGLGKSSPPPSGLFRVLAFVPEAIAGLAVLVAAWFALRFLVRRLRRRLHVERPGEERAFVFSWAHLLAQLRALLLHLRLRFRLRRPAVTAVAMPEPAASAAASVEELGPVRAAYRRFLVAAQAATVGREPAETPRELARRLTLDRRALGTLTGAYERSRYGEAGEDEEVATDAADALALELSRPRRGEASPGPT